MKNALAASMPILCTCCFLGGNDRHYLERYDVVIDSAFTTDQLAGAVAATDTWQKGAGVELTVSIGPCSDWNAHICIVPVHDAASVEDNTVGNTDYPPSDAGGRCRIYVDRIAQTTRWGYDPSEVFRKTVEHELGHAFMGPRHLDPGSLMAVYVGEQADALTANDLVQFHLVRQE